MSVYCICTCICNLPLIILDLVAEMPFTVIAPIYPVSVLVNFYSGSSGGCNLTPPGFYKGNTLDRSPVYHRVKRQTNMFTLQFRVSRSNMHVLGLWEETREPGGTGSTHKLHPGRLQPAGEATSESLWPFPSLATYHSPNLLNLE